MSELKTSLVMFVFCITFCVRSFAVSVMYRILVDAVISLFPVVPQQSA